MLYLVLVLMIVFAFIMMLGCRFTFFENSNNQFQEWWPEYAFAFKTILHDNCTTEYGFYLHAEKENIAVDDMWRNITRGPPPNYYTGGNQDNRVAQPVVNCILKNTSEYIRSVMASSQVLLGLTPTLLAGLGPSTEETALLFVIGRRPVLALGIAAGSSAVFPLRSFDYKDPVQLLNDRKGRWRPTPTRDSPRLIDIALEYTLVGAAVYNVIELSEKLGTRVICTFAPHLTVLQLLWTFTITIIHCLGSLTLLLRAYVDDPSSSSSLRASFSLVYSWVRIQFTRFEMQKPIKVVVLPETPYCIMSSWFTATLTIIHNIYGTLVFSSMLFIGVKDSLTVIGRYFASAICCRIVLMIELAYLRDAIITSDNEDAAVELRDVGSHDERRNQDLRQRTW